MVAVTAMAGRLKGLAFAHGATANGPNEDQTWIITPRRRGSNFLGCRHARSAPS